MKEIIGCVLMLSLCSLAHAQQMPNGFVAVMKSLEQSESLKVEAFPTIIELETWKAEAGETDASVAIPALVRLWVAGNHESFIELEWWKKRENAAFSRMLILALYECLTAEPTSAKPTFGAYAERFAEAEKRARMEEISTLASQRSEIAKSLVVMIKRTPLNVRSKHINRLLMLYEKTASLQ